MLDTVVLSTLRQAFHDHAALDRQIWTLAALRAINTVGLSLVLWFVGAYLVHVRGMPATTYGIIAFVVNVAQSGASHWAGRASDRVGRVRIMLWAQVLRSLAVGGIGVCLIVSGPLPLIVALMVANGILRGCFEPVASAIVADVVTSDRRVAAFGLQRMGVNLGWVIGPASAGVLTDALGYGWPVVLASPFLVGAAIVTARMREPVRPAVRPDVQPTRIRDLLFTTRRHPELILLLAGAFVFSIAHIQQFTTLQNYAVGELGIAFSTLGLLYTVNGLGVLLFQIPAVALIARVRPERAQVVAAVLWLAAFALFGLAEGPRGLALAILVMTAGEVLLSPAQQATMASIGDPREMGRAFGALGTAQTLGVAVAPVLGGLAYDHLRDRHLSMWGALAIGPLLMLLVYLRFARVVTAPPATPAAKAAAAARAATAPVSQVIGPEVSGPIQR